MTRRADQCACGNRVEAERWVVGCDTCWDCAGQGCGAVWVNGEPVEKCDGCDCQIAQLVPWRKVPGTD